MTVSATYVIQPVTTSGNAAASGAAIRVDDIGSDPRSAQRDVDATEGIRAMLSVPLRVAGEIIGAISSDMLEATKASMQSGGAV